MKKKNNLDKINGERFQTCMDEIAGALQKMRRIIGDDDFCFVGSLTVYEKYWDDVENKGEFKNDGYSWSIGDVHQTSITAQILNEEIQEEFKKFHEEITLDKKVIPIGFGSNPPAEA